MLRNIQNNTDQHIRKILNQSLGTDVFLVAHNIGLFTFINNTQKSFEEIAEHFHFSNRATHILLSVCIDLGFIEVNNLYYQLTVYAKEYLIASSPYYYGSVLDLVIENRKVRTFDSIKQALFSNCAQVHDGNDLFSINECELEQGEQFTKAMHQKSVGAAQKWPEHLDISHYHHFLDIGGATGTHTFSVCAKWSHLQATIFDLPSVCQLAQKAVNHSEFTQHIHVVSGDMWNDKFPLADIHFYSDIFHDWTHKQCYALAEKSFSSLEDGGMIIIHEMLFSKDKMSPSNVIYYNLNMLLWTKGQQFSVGELTKLLSSIGFINIFHQLTFGDWGIVGGYKPTITT